VFVGRGEFVHRFSTGETAPRASALTPKASRARHDQDWGGPTAFTAVRMLIIIAVWLVVSFILVEQL